MNIRSYCGLRSARCAERAYPSQLGDIRPILGDGCSQNFRRLLPEVLWGAISQCREIGTWAPTSLIHSSHPTDATEVK